MCKTEIVGFLSNYRKLFSDEIFVSDILVLRSWEHFWSKGKLWNRKNFNQNLGPLYDQLNLIEDLTLKDSKNILNL